ncbi:O-antigen polymerase [Candidatus Scalindua japonica]|uniref:O-antigen polymerase n=2 Tax=Candidatus Scalindua japonica TaxID=1284222 RepID=A0A286TTJ1_9BACT|nr:O-antigen polymerase [Candidatus Scalindua japonica]
MAVILIVLVNLVKDKSDLILVLSVLIAGLFVQELVTFIQAYFKTWFTFTGNVEHTTLQSTTKPEVFRAGGTIGVHNVQAAYYVLLISLTTGIYFITQNIKLKLVLFLVISGGLLSVLLSYSRNGYLSLVSALTIVLFFGWRKKYINIKHLIAGAWLILFSAFFVYYMFGGESIIERIKSKAAIDPRMEGIYISLNMIQQNPFAGVGLNNYSIVMGDRNYSPEGISNTQKGYFGGEFFGTVVHNKYLLVASETGIVGLIFFIWTHFIIFLYAFKLLKSRDKLYWGIGAGMIAALTGASIQMLFSIYNADLLITVYWVLVGLIFVSYKISIQEEKNLCLEA